MCVSKEFILAGNAVFTIESPDEHWTYEVSKVDANAQWPTAWFVRVLCGPSNIDDYVYAGKLDTYTGQLILTAKSAFPETAMRVRVFNRILARIWSGDHTAYEQHGWKTHHEGQCGRCGRRLTVPESIERGIGPECWSKMGLDVSEQNHRNLAVEMEMKLAEQRLEIEQEQRAFEQKEIYRQSLMV